MTINYLCAPNGEGISHIICESISNLINLEKKKMK